MEDTTQASRELADQILSQKSAGERLLMCAELYEEAKEFARIGMPTGLSPEDQKLFVFRRIHGRSPSEIADS